MPACRIAISSCHVTDHDVYEPRPVLCDYGGVMPRLLNYYQSASLSHHTRIKQKSVRQRVGVMGFKIGFLCT
jgi:hypothetical protein